MRILPSFIIASLALSACQLHGGSFGAPDPKRPAVTGKKAIGTASAKAAVAKDRQDALVRSIHNALGATRASKVSMTLNETSGVLANNGSNLISDNGLGVIANNGSSLGGKAYRVAAALRDYDVETDSLVYRFHYASEKAGELKIYEKETFHSLPEADREQALLDHFKWDDIGFDLDSLGPPIIAYINFPMQKVSSKRIPFADKFTCRKHVEVTNPATQSFETLGWEYLIDIQSQLLGGQVDKASFKAVAGRDDLTWFNLPGGGKQSIPNRLKLTGTNATGRYDGTVEYADNQLQMTHTTKDGAKTQILYVSPPKGQNELTITCEEAKLKLTATVEKGHPTGSGQVLDLSGAQPQAIAPLTYDENGVATITFPDGTKAQAQLF